MSDVAPVLAEMEAAPWAKTFNDITARLHPESLAFVVLCLIEAYEMGRAAAVSPVAAGEEGHRESA